MLTLEKLFAVVAEKFRVGACELLRQFNLFAFERNEVQFKRDLRKETFETLAQDHGQFLRRE